MQGINMIRAAIATSICVALCACASSARAERTTLTVWGTLPISGKEADPYASALIADFRQKHPSVEIKYLFLTVDEILAKTHDMIHKGSEAIPDIMQTWGGAPFSYMAENGYFLDVTDDLAALPIPPAARDAMSWKGRMYGAMPFVATSGLYANLDLLSKAGVQAPTTVDQLEAAADALMRSGVQPFACGASDKWPPLAMYMYMVDCYEPGVFPRAQRRQAEIDSEPFTKAAERIQAWAVKGYFGQNPAKVGYFEARAQMMAGKAAMMVTGSWMNEAFSSVSTDQRIGFFPFPGSGATIMGLADISYSVTVMARGKREAAIDFLKCSIDPRMLSAGSSTRVPTMRGVLSSGPMMARQKEFFLRSTRLQCWWDQDLPEAITTPLNTMVCSFLLPETDVKLALSEYRKIFSEAVGRRAY
jgi:raffinose/stachyose/melibiose transport system substrate-binding protein